MATIHQYTTTRRTTVKRETVKAVPVSVRPKAHVEIIGDLDLVLIDGLVPMELAKHIQTLVRLYQAGTLTLS